MERKIRQLQNRIVQGEAIVELGLMRVNAALKLFEEIIRQLPTPDQVQAKIDEGRAANRKLAELVDRVVDKREARKR